MNDPGQVVEALWDSLEGDDLSFVARTDSERLAVERARLPEHRREILKSPTYGLKNRFSMWESLIQRMEHGWAPSGYYLVEEYLNDLISRSTLSQILDAAPSETREKMKETLADLDRRFLDCTIHDQGAELGRWRSVKPSAIADFLWERRPITLPWDH